MVYTYVNANGETVTRNVPGPVCLTKSPESQRGAVCARALANMRDETLPRVELRPGTCTNRDGTCDCLSGTSAPLVNVHGRGYRWH